ncbi:hypothetical protein [Azohydromonas australica]|uniref:hypothetical protein n=1 Tax=Azohydromonas australica TaxID=364039 RepID=UPI000401EB37|nr:hypothetical protein [Azohydromonas australica]
MQRLFHTIAFGCCLGAVLAACAGAGIGGSADTAVKAQEPRGTGQALSLVVDTESGGQNPGQIVLTLRNEGVETATNLQPMLLPFHFRMVHDGCSDEPLPSAASCSYKLALQENGPRTGTLAVNVRYDYADVLDRNARVELAYPVALAPVAAAGVR